MSAHEFWELASYIVTVFGLPCAIAIFIWEQRRERQNEDEEINQRLYDSYTNFIRLVLDNADLGLLRRTTSNGQPVQLTAEQEERKFALFNILIAIFERAFILVYEDNMNPQTKRLWLSWEDYMREWCRRPDFRAALPELLRGEDPAFANHIARIATAESTDKVLAQSTAD